MRGLDPRIHLKKKHPPKKMDCRVKPGNDNRNIPRYIAATLRPQIVSRFRSAITDPGLAS